jgi:inner membrane protein
MLGKTHVVGSLALMHVGLTAYTAYKNRGGDVHIMFDRPDVNLEILGFQFGRQLSLLEYSLIVMTVSLFILWLLRIGGRRMLIGYFGAVVLGISALLLVFDSNYSFQLALILLSFSFGTVLPDIDSEDSTIGKYIKPISRLIPHRTITHTIWAVLAIAGLAWSFESIYFFALALGYAVHIAEDSFSKQGIRWFYPIPAFRFKRWRFPFAYETGGFAESMMFLLAIGTHTLCAGIVIWSKLGLNL